MRRLEGHTHDVMALAFAPDGRRLASAGWDGTIRLWNLVSGACERCIRTTNDHALDVAFSPDGKFIAAGFRAKFLNPDYGTVAWFPVDFIPNDTADSILPGDSWFAHRPQTRSVSFAPDGRCLLTCGSGAYVDGLLIWDLIERTVIERIPGSSMPILAARFRPDGAAVAAASSELGKSIFVWDRGNSVAFRGDPYLYDFPGDKCGGVAWSPDNASLAATFESGNIVWWKPGTEELATMRSGPKTPPTVRSQYRFAAGAIAFSPDGRLLLTAGQEGLIHMWDNATHSRLTTFDWQIGDVRGLAFAPDGLTAAAAGNGTILLWDIDA